MTWDNEPISCSHKTICMINGHHFIYLFIYFCNSIGSLSCSGNLIKSEANVCMYVCTYVCILREQNDIFQYIHIYIYVQVNKSCNKKEKFSDFFFQLQWNDCPPHLKNLFNFARDLVILCVCVCVSRGLINDNDKGSHYYSDGTS